MSTDPAPIPSEAALEKLYGPDGVAEARSRFDALSRAFKDRTGAWPEAFFTAAGRTEIGGNHTDHQHGNVLAASVNLDNVGCARTNDQGVIRVMSTQYPDDVVEIGQWEAVESEKGSSRAIVRGLGAGLQARGYELSGVDVLTDSKVPGGSGLSSSAAFEVLLGNVLNSLFCGGELGPVEIAQCGQFAENAYFGKPSGLLDQISSSHGGAIAVDFADADRPQVTPVEVDLDKAGYAMYIIDSGGDHSDLTDEYAAIAIEMDSVAQAFGKKHLREVDPEEFWAALPALREQLGDRAVRRAGHFFDEDKRVGAQVKALQEGRFDDFLDLVNQSGISSETRLQNIYAGADPSNQSVGVAIDVARHALGGRGAVRVHGGGFAGVVQAYVPLELADQFTEQVEAALGEGSCTKVWIRPTGGAQVF